MKKRPLALTRLSTLLSSLAMIPAASRAATLVDLDATTLPLGTITSWTNNGTLGGSFAAADTPQVMYVAGYRTVNLAGANQYFTGPAASAAITGVNKPVTVEAWVYNPNIPSEETVLAWGRRGGGEGTNASYNYGSHQNYGAVGHWGGPDMGWNDQDITPGAPAANAWHYLVWTYDGVTERLYSDGTAMHFENKNLNVWALDSNNAPLPIRLGAQNEANGVAALFNDGINLLRIRVKDTVMTPGEISTNYTNEKAALDATRSTSITSFTASPADFLPGEAVTLTWTISAATSASIDNGVGALTPLTTGSVVVHPTTAVTYTLNASNAVGGATASVALRPYSRPVNAHRWSFNESNGILATDSAGGTDAIIQGSQGASTSGSGLWERTGTQVKLGGGGAGTSAYIDLPNHLLSGLTGVTVEGWMTLNSSQNWGRIFDFGVGSTGEIQGPGGGFNGVSYFMLSSQFGGDQNVKRLELQPSASNVDVNDPVVPGEEFHFAVVYDPIGNAGQPRALYYKNGVLKATLNTSQQLNTIDDVNNWLGRSNWGADNNIDGSYNEFRVWNGPLRKEDVVQSFTSGPDAVTLPATSAPAITAFSASQRVFAPGEAVTLTWNTAGAPTTVSIDQGVGTVSANGSTVLHPTTAATYTLTATNTYGTSTRQIQISPVHLSHRWSFNEASGTVVKDSVGGANGAVIGTPGTVAAGNGLWSRDGRSVSIGGGDSHTAAYVDLPNHLLSPLTDVTIEGWATINSAQGWGRLFDFGNGQLGELLAPGGDAQGTNYFILSGQIGTDQNVKRLEYNNGGPVMDIQDPAVQGQRFHYAVVYDSKGNGGLSPKLSYYKNGVLISEATTSRPLSAVDDVNNWLGRSNWTADANLDGGFDEFRMWDTPLNASQIAASATAGPDALPFAPAATTPLTFGGDPVWNYSGGVPVSVQINWNGTPGRSYMVEYSTDLTNWQTARNAAGDALILTATTAANSSSVALAPGERTFLRIRDISAP